MRTAWSGLLIFLVAVAGAVPGTAIAAATKRCGDAGTMYGGEVTLAKVTARNTTCKKARAFARSFTRNSGEESGYRCSEDFYCDWRGWQCRNDGRKAPLKHRCETVNTKTRKLMVISWVDQTG